MVRTSFLAAAMASAASVPALAVPQLAPVWSDHAVVQRDAPVRVEGTAAAGERVSGTLGESTATAQADAQGRFTLEFPARSASDDPLTLSVRGADGSTTTVSDILVGDVWLCSGQSNMEFPVARNLNGDAIAQSSADDGLRLLMIPKATAVVPQVAFAKAASWAAAAPETVPQFSAACYVMAKTLRERLGVPIGAIHSNWGGSQIRAWVTPEAGRRLYGEDQMALLERISRDPLGAVTAFAPTWEAWWRAASGGEEPWRDPDALSWQPVPSIAPWTTWAGTPLATDAIGNVWLRRTIELTAEQAAAGGTLALGVLDDLDATWVNGRSVGITHGWDHERQYPVPPAYLKAGSNEIVVAVSNSWAAGGFTSTADKLAFTVDRGARLPLGDGWRYSIGKIDQAPPRAPWDANAGIGVMHNWMVAPLGRIAIKGAAWYQGESDVGIPGYGDRMRELFSGWRAQFGPQMQMLVVQLANYGPVAELPTASGWAETRDIQLEAVMADTNAALVTAIDIGERTDIHPANKTLLGDRLARAALGEPMPMPQSARLDGDTVTVRFTGVEGGLRTWSGPHPLGVELCNEAQDSCRFALAAVDGDRLLIPTAGRPATRVRYAWADSPVVNLFDGRSLPVPGFELEVAR
jgi:sialate O-acetylesterase